MDPRRLRELRGDRIRAAKLTSFEVVTEEIPAAGQA